MKYPLECGCTGPKYWAKCNNHKAEEEADSARLMGIADIRLTHRDFTDLTKLAATLITIKLQLISNPTKSCLIKITPGEKNETDASSRD
jgi:hypothetical protein